MDTLEITKDLLFIMGGFLLGSIPFCFILARLTGRKNLKEIGDKNPGGWNLVFNVSKVWGLVGILLDMAKGYFSYYIVLGLAYESSAAIMGTNHNQLIAVLAGCAAVAGHNYSPFLNCNGGKGIAAWGGFMTAGSWYAFPVGGFSLLMGILLTRNMIWSVILGIVMTCLFLWFYTDAAVFVFASLLLLVIMLPRQLNRQLPLGKNFQFWKEASLGDLFKPKLR
jgi:acyl phosphate:glycerol-3-phosphate acyltransferase